MHAIKKRRRDQSLSNSELIMNDENEYVSIFDSIESKTWIEQLKYYKNKLVFLELPEIRELYGKDYIQQEKRETTEKFRNLLKMKEKIY
jgi:hypothetical protein